ncbi:MAG: hypothetical protein ACQKBT_12645, partial [Puniceicoccales bacterium]
MVVVSGDAARTIFRRSGSILLSVIIAKSSFGRTDPKPSGKTAETNADFAISATRPKEVALATMLHCKPRDRMIKGRA